MMAQTGHADTNIFAMATTSAATSADASTRAYALHDLAAVMAQVGHADAAATFALATTSAATITDVSRRAYALRDLAAAMAAARCWKEAMTTAVTITDASTRAYALRDLAAVMAQVGHADAAATFALATTAAAAITHEGRRSETLRDLHSCLHLGSPSQCCHRLAGRHHPRYPPHDGRRCTSPSGP
jgi:hypothetical protein